MNHKVDYKECEEHKEYNNDSLNVIIEQQSETINDLNLTIASLNKIINSSCEDIYNYNNYTCDKVGVESCEDPEKTTMNIITNLKTDIINCNKIISILQLENQEKNNKIEQLEKQVSEYSLPDYSFINSPADSFTLSKSYSIKESINIINNREEYSMLQKNYKNIIMLNRNLKMENITLKENIHQANMQRKCKFCVIF